LDLLGTAAFDLLEILHEWRTFNYC